MTNRSLSSTFKHSIFLKTKLANAFLKIYIDISLPMYLKGIIVYEYMLFEICIGWMNIQSIEFSLFSIWSVIFHSCRWVAMHCRFEVQVYILHSLSVFKKERGTKSYFLWASERRSNLFPFNDKQRILELV